MKDRRLLTIALASVLALASTIALAGTVRHKPNARAFDSHVPQLRSRVVQPSYGNPDGTVSAGGYMWNGRSASEEGGG
jgi:hypothetical protein